MISANDEAKYMKFIMKLLVYPIFRISIVTY